MCMVYEDPEDANMIYVGSEVHLCVHSEINE